MKIFNLLPRKALCLIASAVITGLGIYLGEETDFFSSVCALAAIYVLINYVSTRDKKTDTASVILGIIFSAIYIIAEHYSQDGGLTPLFTGKHEPVLSVARFLFLIPLFYFGLRGILIFLREHAGSFTAERQDEKSPKRVFLIPFFIILIAWLPWTLINYPGTFSPDATSQLSQMAGLISLTAHHPPLSSFIMWALLRIGMAVWDANFGCYLYLLLHTVFGAFVFALGIKKLYGYGLKTVYLGLITVFFALVPFWGAYAQWYEKDLLYVEMTALFTIYFAEAVIKKDLSRSGALKLAVTALLSALLRNNGIYAMLPALFLMIFLLNDAAKKRILAPFAAVLIVWTAVTKFLYPVVLNVQDGSTSVMLAVPFQQTARYVYFYGDELTDEEKAAIDGVLSYEYMTGNYDAHNAGELQNTYKQDDALLGKYFEAWGSMFLKHPGVYIEATLANTYAVLAPVAAGVDGAVLTEIEPEYSFFAELGVHRTVDERAAKIFEFIRISNVRIAVLNFLAMPGFYTWVLILCAFVFIKAKKPHALLMLVPCFMNLLAISAGPAPGLFRFSLPLAASLPFIIGMFAASAASQFHLSQTPTPRA